MPFIGGFDEQSFPASKTVGVASEVTLVTPIRQGRIPEEYRTYRKRLEDVLNGLQDREGNQLPTPISVIGQIHFARWIIHDPVEGGRPVLIFTSNFDGEMRHYFRNFSLHIPDDIDRVWRNCEGYPENGARDFDRLWQYVKRHQVRTSAFYNAYRTLTVPQILGLDRLKQAFDDFVAGLGPEGAAGPGPERLRQELDRLLLTTQLPPGGRPIGPRSAPPEAGQAERLQAAERHLRDALRDIQANILRSPNWRRAGYYFLQITDAARFRAALRPHRLASADDAVCWAGLPRNEGATLEPPSALNIGFTSSGLAELGLDTDLLASLPLPFRQGMAARAAILGDLGESAPKTWDGSLGSQHIHAVIAVLSMDRDPDCLWAKLWAKDGGAAPAGSVCLHREIGRRLYDRTGRYPIEHFGFRDGISQPFVQDGGPERIPGDGFREAEGRSRPIPAGEFLLGHLDADGKDQLVATPVLRELCRNGTYMVFRKLRQDVEGFRAYVTKKGGVDPDRLAARMMGRWPDGTPLATCPEGPRQAEGEALNGFTYAEDPDGRRCPFAAHVRRTNPRGDGDPAEVNRHRIIRRGIPYDDGRDKGMLFVCFNARIDSQFEFLQSEWCNKGDVLGHVTEARDPIASSGGSFIIPGSPGPLAKMPAFVTTRGGDYFFVPGLSALKRILEGGFERPSAPPAANPETLPPSPQSFDPVAYLAPAESAMLLKERGIRRAELAWDNDRQTVHYVAGRDQIAAILADETRFTVEHNARKIRQLVNGYDARAWRRPDEPPLRAEAIGLFEKALLGMSGTEPEKQERLSLLRQAMRPEDVSAIERLAADTMEKSLAGQSNGRFDLVQGAARLVPLRRVMFAFGIAPPTVISAAHMALYFGRESFAEVERMGWLDRFPKFCEQDIPVVELGRLTRSIATYLLIDLHEREELAGFGRMATAALLDHIANSILAAEAAPPEKLGNTLLARLLRLRPSSADRDPALAQSFRIRIGMILAELAVGGTDTTAKAIANVMDYLLDDATRLEQGRQALAADDDDASLMALIHAALVEKPVAPVLERYCPAGAELELPGLDGRMLPRCFEAKSRIFLLIGAALKDRAPWLDPKRPANIGFGDGPHACLGREIALAEVRSVLKALLPYPRLRRAAGPEGVYREQFRLPEQLVVRLD